MANQRPKALFFIFLLLSSHAYRLETGDIHASLAKDALNSTAVKLLQRQQPGSYGAARTSASQGLEDFYHIFDCTRTGRCLGSNYQSATSGTTAFQEISVLEVGGLKYSRNPIAAAAELCAPGLYTPGTLTPLPPIGPTTMQEMMRDAGGGGGKFGDQHSNTILAELEPYWPLLIAAGVVAMGGLYLYHRHRMNAPLEATFCPVSSWEADPVGMLVGPAALESFDDRFSTLLSEDNNRGMPKCHGLRRHRLRSDCDGDVDCKRQACRQMCCDRRDCSFYQFNTIDSTDNCWLGSRSRLTTTTCESPFFGETCTSCRDRRMELWPQIHENNVKCHSALVGFTGFHVENQYECQAHAVEQGHPFYQYDAVRHKCETEATCDSPSSHTVHNWQIFSNQNMPPPQPAAARPRPEQEVWQFEPFLLHENQGMTTVQLARSERCSSGDVTCMRDACRAQCVQHDWCIHYQFESGGHACQLGATHVIDEDDVGMWFGGILTQNRLCAADEYKCPSSHNCVQACGGECDGHGREGPDGWCVRSAIQNIVDDGGWTDNYNAHSIDAWCRGLERSVVTVTAGLADGQTGADICRAACSADSNCAIWQMYPRDADQSDLSEGDHVRCWLGMEDQLGRARFTCTGRSPKRWRLLSAPRSESVMTRGCRDGKVACVLSQRCVDLCADECPGFDITDTEAGHCQPPPNPQCIDEGVPMNLGMAQNLPQMMEYDEYTLLARDEDLFTMSVNLNNVINPDTFQGDTTAVCDVIEGAECDLINGACVCEYDEDVDCDMLFGHSERVAPVLAAEGMMLMSHRGCSCEGRTCTLRLLSSVPPIRTSVEANSAVQLRANEAQVCDPSQVCPNMNRCSVIAFGSNGCGWECENDDGKYWCSDRCACNKEEAVAECAADVMCPNMHSCNPISYGEYGCGYGCMRDSTFYFCNDACTVCNE